jgi:putative chitinase
MPITQMQFLQIIPAAGSLTGVFVPALNAAMARFHINTPARVSAFLAQTGHESAYFTRLVESLNYSVEALISTFTRERISEADARAYGRTPIRKANQVAIANCIYGGAWGAKKLGNTQPGDGWRYRGRSLIQITGRANYAACGKALGLDLLNYPEQLEEPEKAAMAAAWYWSLQKLNTLADVGNLSDIGSIINTGKPGRIPLGAQEREALYERALRVTA